ncbi:MAG: hypothetical protein IPM34_14315 [Saprospiraceae bacterium]|nr:hypothetical protein [Saprospiraceae bacterium]
MLHSLAYPKGIIFEKAFSSSGIEYPRKIITCKEKVIELTAPVMDDPENCYLWQPVADMYKYSYQVTVEPQITTDYTIQITNYTTGASETYTITVYVVDHIDLYENQNISECMEFRPLHIQGILAGHRMDEISWSQQNYLYVLITEGGQIYNKDPWFPVVGGEFSLHSAAWEI